MKTSTTTKARLLHYFPPENGDLSTSTNDVPEVIPFSKDSKKDENDHGYWCATHIDHGCLTGLTSALYIDENINPSQLLDNASDSSFLPPLPYLSSPPSPSGGLHVYSRNSTISKIAIPSDCLAFQTGEALQLITEGKFRAVPHFVRAGTSCSKVARNTLAVFTQPDLGEVVNKKTGTTFGEFCKEVAGRFG